MKPFDLRTLERARDELMRSAPHKDDTPYLVSYSERMSELYRLHFPGVRIIKAKPLDKAVKTRVD